MTTRELVDERFSRVVEIRRGLKAAAGKNIKVSRDR